ncbi:uncharacterized protein LOC110615399 [Manihot esculenta]|uniref:uncharacterized protein LOC110615399 n=1 Tax=Manihot esculenta TaxID=3983 RepID=UPI000B5D4A04|nr:uncharacterized protein LOC110615399 [Manihot esculenta]
MGNRYPGTFSQDHGIEKVCSSSGGIFFEMARSRSNPHYHSKENDRLRLGQHHLPIWDTEEELSSILWAFRTTPRTPTKETPFALAFGTEAVVPIELQVPTHRVQFNNEDTNSDKLRSNLDALEEIRDEAQIRTAAYQQKAVRYYNQKVRERSLKVGDLALRKLKATGKRAVVGKLAPTWEGPFRIIKVVKAGVY